MRVDTGTVRTLEASTSIHTDRARLRAALEALSDALGFDGAVAAMQSEVQSLAERCRRRGQSTGGYIG